MTAAHRRQKPREETEARLLRERGTPEERIGPVVPDGALYPQPESSAATTAPRFWRLRWWLARTFKTREYRYVESEMSLPEVEHVIRVAETGEEIPVSREDFIDIVAGRLLYEHSDTLRKLAEDD